MLIPRVYQDLGKYIKRGKVLVIFGPRQVGKTTLVKEFLKKTDLKYKYDSGELLNIQAILSSQDLSKLKAYTDGYELIVVDEAHKISKIGINLKIIVDQIPGVDIIVTGSSSFDLLNQVGEPLVGRKKTLKMFPVWQGELGLDQSKYELAGQLEDYLVYGSYPEVVTAKTFGQKREVLAEIAQGYLLKDILEFQKVKSSKLLFDLLVMLAFQMGNEVSLTELGGKIGLDVKTVGRYLDLFEKSYILFNLRGFSRNLRNEITKMSKYYFYDNGVRNALISNFNGLDKRDDVGQLWENFLVVERLKYQEYKNKKANNYFWRTWEGQEIDWVEERGGQLTGFEFKYQKDKIKAPKLWRQTYKEARFEVVNRENYMGFVM